jgi:hypothetical protein
MLPSHTQKRSIVMAHKAAALYRTVKIGDVWIFRTVDGEPVHLSEGSYYLNYN